MKTTLKYLSAFTITIFLLVIFSPMTLAHGQIDLSTQLEKKQRYLSKYQNEFTALVNSKQRYKNLKRQIDNMQSSVLLLQHHIVQKGGSKSLDEEVDLLKFMKINLGAMKVLLVQSESLLKSGD